MHKIFKKMIKKAIHNLGYELKRKRVNDIHVDIASVNDIESVMSPTMTQLFGQNKKQFQNSLGPEEFLIIKSSPNYKILSIDAIYQERDRWGFIPCSVGDLNFFMFLGGKDDGVALRFLHNGSYEKKTMSLWILASESARMILDVGAHTGSYSIAAKLTNLDADVLSFEPHYLNYSRLTLNLRANGLNTDQAYMLAVSDVNKKLMFSVPRGSDYHSSGGYIGFNDDLDSYLVTSVALDSFIDEDFFKRVDLIKIDTEGYEVNCLIGMKKIIEINLPTIFFECIAQPDKQLEEIFFSLGYEIFLVNDNTGALSRVNTVCPEIDIHGKIIMNLINRIAIHPSKNLKFK